MPQYTEKELAEMGRELLVRREKDKRKAKAYNQALRRLISTHQTEFDQFLTDARAEFGVH